MSTQARSPQRDRFFSKVGATCGTRNLSADSDELGKLSRRIGPEPRTLDGNFEDLQVVRIFCKVTTDVQRRHYDTTSYLRLDRGMAIINLRGGAVAWRVSAADNVATNRVPVRP